LAGDRCPARFKTEGCSLAGDFDHEIHIALNHEGHIVARWRVEVVELPIEGVLPDSVGPKYL